MEKLVTPKGHSYWANNAPYSELFKERFKDLVPKEGSCDNLHGELIRCFAKLNYDFHNNGNINVLETEMHTCTKCHGSGYKEVDCTECESYNSVGEECQNCNNLGVEYKDCSECDGECEIPTGVILITQRYRNYINFLIKHLDDNSCMEKLMDFLFDNTKGYHKYTYSDEETQIYNAIGDSIGYQLLTTANSTIKTDYEF